MATTKPRITVVSVGASKTLAELLTAAGVTGGLLPGCQTLLVPAATGIYMDDGTASALSHPMGLSIHELDGSSEMYDELEFFAAAATNMSVIEERAKA